LKTALIASSLIAEISKALENENQQSKSLEKVSKPSLGVRNVIAEISKALENENQRSKLGKIISKQSPEIRSCDCRNHYVPETLRSEGIDYYLEK
jgi:hypothetical protein